MKTTNPAATPNEQTIEILRANAVGENNAPLLNITVAEIIPEEMDLKKLRETYNKQGKLLSDALFNSLPGGTIDALLCEMMKRRASLFCIPIDA